MCHPNTIGYHKQMIVPLSGQVNESETHPPMDTNNNILGASQGDIKLLEFFVGNMENIPILPKHNFWGTV